MRSVIQGKYSRFKQYRGFYGGAVEGAQHYTRFSDIRFPLNRGLGRSATLHRAAVSSNDVLSFELNPENLGNETLSFDTGVIPSATSPSLKLDGRGYNLQANNSSTVSRPPINLTALTKATSPQSVSGQFTGAPLENPRHLYVSAGHRCFSLPKDRYAAGLYSETRSSASWQPVLHGNHKSHPAALVRHCVEVHAAELCVQDSSVHLHFLQLIMELISFHEAIAHWSTHEACYRSKILEQLYDHVGYQLVKLHSKLEQDLCKSMLGRHTELGHKKFFEDNGFVVCRLRDYLLSKCLSDSFGKELKGDYLSNSAH
jgi:hypothetical protein